jgi:hypothetical protein
MTTDYLILHGQIKNLALKYIDPFDKSKVEDFEKDYEKLLGRQTNAQLKKGAHQKREHLKIL